MALQNDPTTSLSVQFEQLLTAINKVEANVNAKLLQMKHELMERESSDDWLVKKKHILRKGHHLKLATRSSTSSTNRYETKSSPLSLHWSSLIRLWKRPEHSLRKVRNSLSENVRKIKIVDRSEHGWATVLEYDEDELADNSDDGKWLFRAKARAGRNTKRS